MLAVGIVVVFILAFAAVVYLVLGGARARADVHADGSDQFVPAAGFAETADGQDTSFRSYSDELTKLEFAYLPHNEHHHIVTPGA